MLVICRSASSVSFQQSGLIIELLKFSGQLHEVATQFYGLSLQVEQVEMKESSQGSGSGSGSGSGYQFCFRLNFENSDYMASRLSLASCGGVAGIDGWDTLSPIKGSMLLRLFPLGFVFRPDLHISATGSQLSRMYPQESLMDQQLQTVAELRKPNIKCTWPNVSQVFININIFIKF